MEVTLIQVTVIAGSYLLYWNKLFRYCDSALYWRII